MKVGLVFPVASAEGLETQSIDPAAEKNAAASSMRVALANTKLVELHQLIFVFMRMRTC
jgi:hypothetical protein